ncbi:MAG TPA: hypothetical protein VM387_10145, partial [Gemmatimonadales bacterium]|nr:hypothetical protein [Gemmatimonadales bacterium]
MVANSQQQPDLGHHDALPERLASLPRRDGQQVGPGLAKGAHRSAQELGSVAGVGVGEEQQIAAGRP